jgi:hypothetical protein
MARRSILLSCVLFACAPGAAAAPKPGWESVSETRFYTATPVAADDTVNPLRGYHRWQNQELVPQAASALDAFRRYYWRDLESAEGQYNFAPILNDMAAARQSGRKFAFRLRMMAGYDDDQHYGPAYLVGNARCAAGCGFWADADPADPGLTWIPDWNDPYLLSRARALLTALASAIGPTDALAWIDVGLYGQYGEWALRSSVYVNPPPGIGPVTPANKREYAKMHFEAFPSQQFVMFVPYSNKDALTYGLLEQTITSKPVGLRVDCLAQDGYFKQWSDRPDAEWAPFSEQWRRAPFIAEFCPFNSGEAPDGPATARLQAATYHISSIGNANFALSLPDAERWASFNAQEQNDLLMLGRESGYRYSVDKTSVTLSAGGQINVAATIANRGSAPSYERWHVRLELVNGAGAVVWNGLLPAALGNLHGGNVSQVVQGSWLLPALPGGTYALRLVAREAPSPVPGTAPLRPPLKWTVNERGADGGVTLRTLRRR